LLPINTNKESTIEITSLVKKSTSVLNKNLTDLSKEKNILNEVNKKSKIERIQLVTNIITMFPMEKGFKKANSQQFKYFCVAIILFFKYYN